jgi:imidazolonepropionase
MKRTLIHNISRIEGIVAAGIKSLRGTEMADMQSIENGWLLMEGDRISAFGSSEDVLPEKIDARIDAEQGLVMPSYCDSHSHLVFARGRETEFEDRIKGLSYEEIAERGGGILNSVDKMRSMSEDELYERSEARAWEAIRSGTGALEIKSGYGLDTESEAKILRVARRLGTELPLEVKTTFLGAHAFPREFQEDQDAYIDKIKNAMIPAIAAEGLADYIDVFCERGYFDKIQMEEILIAGIAHGMKVKVHVNQFSSIGGLQMALKHNALSVDHLEVMTEHDIEDICASDTIATALPACSFFIKIPYTPGRQIIDDGGILALATDFNPGSSPCSNMNFVMSLACIHMGMTPAEALAASTLNGAAAMELSEEMGSITVGKRANLIITRPMHSLAQIPYYFAKDPIHKVILSGIVIA